MKEEEKQKQEDKLKHRFASFFLAKKRDVEDEEERDTAGIFKQFRVKEDMQLAPLHRNTLTSDQHEALGEVMMGAQGGQGKLPLTYLALLKAGGHKVRSSARTWPPSTANDDDDDDIEIVDDDDDTTTTATATAPPQKGCPAPPGLRGCGAGRAKLLSFCENRRPAYWGTWSKAGQCVRARRPFLKEPTLDYEYDSNDDWEEEEAGESLSDSEGEEKEEEDNYEVDNDFFVPHGYLSDDEGKEEEEEKNCVKSGDGEMENKNKEKLKRKQAEFEEEMKKKTRELKPRVIGCLWLTDQTTNMAFTQLLKVLEPYRAVRLAPNPIPTAWRGLAPQSGQGEGPGEEETPGGDEKGGKKFVKEFPEEAVAPLIQLLHGNRHGKGFLCREFADYWLQRNSGSGGGGKTGEVCVIAKRKVLQKIREIGVWKKCKTESCKRAMLMWYVPSETREKYGVLDLSIPNTWSYINTPKERKDEDSEVTQDDPARTPKLSKLVPITAFTRKTPTSTPTATSSGKEVTQTGEVSPVAPSTGQVEGCGSVEVSPTPVPTPTPPPSNVTRPNSAGKGKRNRSLFLSGKSQSASFVSFFKKGGKDDGGGGGGSNSVGSEGGGGEGSGSGSDECIILDD
ncbi:chromatin assembly factor 1 subunit A-like [Portunus trituberculatus]|uniref:chromatin assembly factor 1 subunit A-like n=1 Tax=Portunus trituberculatus TaxID=210409 RepID=UPI001E1D2173|nr:chromatin assembly factor 1 subunit A-like [Portunus trituberculatus]